MNVIVTLNGVDISHYVISYTRDKYICNGIGKLSLVLNRTIGNTMVPYDVVIVYEESIKKGTYFVNSSDEKVPDGLITLECQDASKMIADYFIYEMWDTGETRYLCSYIISKYLEEAGVEYNFVTTEGDSEVAEGSSFGLEYAASVITSLCQQCGWYFIFDEENVCQIGSIELGGGNLSITDANLTKVDHREDDDMARNQVKIWGGYTEDLQQFKYNVTESATWQRDSGDDRAIILANGWITTTELAEHLAGTLLDEYNRTTEIYDFLCVGAYEVDAGYKLNFSSSYASGEETVTSIEVTLAQEGLTTRLTVGQRCPRQHAYFGSIIYNEPGEVEFEYDIPFYQTTLNSFDVFETSAIDTEIVVVEDYLTNNIFGVSKEHVFYKVDNILYRYNFVTSTEKSVELTFDLDGYITYIPVVADSGFVIVDEFADGVYTGRLVIYAVNWLNTPSIYIKNYYTYERTDDYYVAPVDSPEYYSLGLAVARREDSVRAVITIIKYSEVEDSADFLVYTEDSNSFDLIIGSGEYYPYAWTEHGTSNYADTGNGYLAIFLPESGLGNPYVVIVNTNDGTAEFVEITPNTSGGAYDFWYETTSIVPYYGSNSFILQSRYEDDDGDYIRILEIYQNGTVLVRDSFEDTSMPYGDYDKFSTGLAFSNNKIISYRYSGNRLSYTEQPETVFYDVLQSTELFRKRANGRFYGSYAGGFYEAISPTLSQQGNKIIKLNSIDDYIHWYINDETIMDSVTANESVKDGWVDGWEWEHWNVTEPSATWVTGYENAGKYYEGIKLTASSGEFTDDMYTVGDLVWSETIAATDGNFRLLGDILDDSSLYMATSEGVMITDNRTLPYVYGTHFDIKYPNGYNFGKEAHVISTAPLNYGGSVDIDDIPYVRPSPDGDHAEVFFYPLIYTEIAQGDNGWTADNSGELTLKVYEAFTDKVELSVKLPIEGVADKVNAYYWDDSEVHFIRKPMVYPETFSFKEFFRIVFTDGTYLESTTASRVYTSTSHPLYNANLYKIRITTTSAQDNKIFSHAVFGMYLDAAYLAHTHNDIKPNKIYGEVVFIDLFTPNINLKTNVVAMSTTGQETVLGTIDQDPDDYDAEIRNFRLLNNTANFQLGYTYGYPLWAILRR